MSRFIRYAISADAATLGKIHSESSKAGFIGIIPDDVLNDVFSVERRTNRFIQELSEGVPKTAIIYDRDEPAGFISFGECRYGNSKKSWIEIWRVYLCPEFWGQGIAKELIEWGISEISKVNITNIELWVLEDNLRARKLYEEIGFRHDNTFLLTNMGKELKELRYIKA